MTATTASPSAVASSAVSGRETSSSGVIRTAVVVRTVAVALVAGHARTVGCVAVCGTVVRTA